MFSLRHFLMDSFSSFFFLWPGNPRIALLQACLTPPKRIEALVVLQPKLSLPITTNHPLPLLFSRKKTYLSSSKFCASQKSWNLILLSPPRWRRVEVLFEKKKEGKKGVRRILRIPLCTMCLKEFEDMMFFVARTARATAYFFSLHYERRSLFFVAHTANAKRLCILHTRTKKRVGVTFCVCVLSNSATLEIFLNTL